MRQGGKIEITEEMVQAGYDALKENEGIISSWDVVREVYTSMYNLSQSSDAH